MLCDWLIADWLIADWLIVDWLTGERVEGWWLHNLITRRGYGARTDD